VWTLIYNVLLFVVACMLLVSVRSNPAYKVALVTLASGIVFVNLYSIMRYYWYEQKRRDLLKAQQDNIVLSTCPDYWNKVATSSGTVCKNEFVSQQGDQQVVHRFGDQSTGSPSQYNLQELTNTMTNQQKCWNFSAAQIPWIDLNNKCRAAGV
jgi:predicted membrane protein